MDFTSVKEAHARRSTWEKKAIEVRTALPRPLTLVMMASLLMEEGALNKFQYIVMVAFLAMRLNDYHHRYLCRPHICCALYVMDYSSARFTSILLFSILAPIFSAVRRTYISDWKGIAHQPGCRAIRAVCHRQYYVTP